MNLWCDTIRRISAIPIHPLRAFALFCLLWTSSATHAQTLLPFDTGGKVYFIYGPFEREHAFLGEPSLYEARIVLDADSSVRLVVTVKNAGGYRLSERVLAPADLTYLRERYTLIAGESIPPDPGEPVPDNSGSAVFVQTFAGLGFSWYGLTLPAIFAPGDAGVVGTYLLTAGGSYFFADGYASGRSISAAQGGAFQYFATRGIAHGYALSGIAMGNDIDHRIAVPVATVASLTEGLIMMGVAGRNAWTEGTVGAIGTYGDAGLILGLSAAYLAGPSSGDFFNDIEGNTRRYSTSLAAASLSGLLLGSYVSGLVPYTAGDAQVQEAIGFLGAAAAFTIADAAGSPSVRTDLWAMTAGLAAGHAIGARIAAVRNIDSDGARLVRLLTSGGIILGLGTAYILSEEGSDRTIYMSMATIGGGLGLIYGLGRVSDVDSDEKSRTFEVNVRPEGLLFPLVPAPYAGFVRHNPVLTCTMFF